MLARSLGAATKHTRHVQRIRSLHTTLPRSMSEKGKNGDEMCATNKSEFETSTDFSNYFCTYGFLYHQKQMLEDNRRMTGYFNGVMKNKECFKDKVRDGIEMSLLWASLCCTNAQLIVLYL